MPNDKTEVTPATTSADTVPDAVATYVTISKGICVFTMYVYYSIKTNLAICITFMKDLYRQNVFAWICTTFAHLIIDYAIQYPIIGAGVYKAG